MDAFSEFKVGDHWWTTQNELCRITRVSVFGIFAKNIRTGYIGMYLESKSNWDYPIIGIAMPGGVILFGKK